MRMDHDSTYTRSAYEICAGSSSPLQPSGHSHSEKLNSTLQQHMSRLYIPPPSDHTHHHTPQTTHPNPSAPALLAPSS